MSNFRPVPDEVADAAVARARATVLEAIHVTPRRRFSRTTSVAIGMTSAVVATVLAGGAFAIAESFEQQVATVNCFAAADVSAPFISIDLTTTTPDGESSVRLSPLTACELPWESGVLTNVDVMTEDSPVPDLVACVQVDGVGATFPREDGLSDEELCGLLGLAEWSSD